MGKVSIGPRLLRIIELIITKTGYATHRFICVKRSSIMGATVWPACRLCRENCV